MDSSNNVQFPTGLVHKAVVHVTRTKGAHGVSQVKAALIGRRTLYFKYLSFKIYKLVGKSALAIQSIHRHFAEDYDGTETYAYRTRFGTENGAYRMDLMDFHCESIEDEVEYFKNQCEICFVVFSVIDHASYEHAIEQLHVLRRFERPNHLPLIYLVGNKIDLVTEQNQDTIVTTEMARAQAEQLNVSLFFTSAKTRFGVDHLMVGATRDFEDAVQNAAKSMRINKARPNGRCSTM